MTRSPSELIAERHKTHGDFRSNAHVSQRLKDVIRAHLIDQGLVLTDVQQESLDMICCKISRICSGQANFPGHWEDIAGYAKLAEQRGMSVSHGEKDSSPDGFAGPL